MKFLLTNDDGIDAPGIQSLFACVQRVVEPSDEIVVVAPDRCRSECGHGVTNDRSLTIKKTRNNWYSVDGTPVDCVRVAITHLACDANVVLSGVNQGANLGVDVLVSGTVAAAREASLYGLPAIALSHYRHPDVPRSWDHVPRWTETVMRQWLASKDQSSTQQGIVWNVNLPAINPDTLADSQVPEIVHCPLDANPHSRNPLLVGNRLRFETNFQSRPRADGSDVQQCFAGAVTVTSLINLPIRS